MGTALAVIDSGEMDTIVRAGKMLAASGYFDGKGETNQAIAMMATKIMAGREMGFGPFASVNGIHIIKGKPSVGANLMAASIKGSGRYDYRVKEMSNEKCVLEFFEVNGKRESLGISEFSMKDAQAAGLTSNDTWKKFPKNMLFARAMSNGVRWYCPDIFSGNVVYVPEELGAEVDGDGNVVDTTYTVTQEEPKFEEAGPDIGDGPEDLWEEDDTKWPDAHLMYPPTDKELNIMGQWKSVDDAYAWAVRVKACVNTFEARNSMSKIVEEHGGKLTSENIAPVYLAFVRRQAEKLQEQMAAQKVAA